MQPYTTRNGYVVGRPQVEEERRGARRYQLQARCIKRHTELTATVLEVKADATNNSSSIVPQTLTGILYDA